MLVQELTEYEQNSFRDPNFCQKMQLKIADILLQDIYTTPDYRFQKAQTLIRKAKALRFSSRIGGLRDCIQCLSTAISIMVNLSVSSCISLPLLSIKHYILEMYLLLIWSRSTSTGWHFCCEVWRIRFNSSPVMCGTLHACTLQTGSWTLLRGMLIISTPSSYYFWFHFFGTRIYPW